MSDSLQVFLVSFLGFMIGFSIVFTAIRAIAVELAHREFGQRIHLERNVEPPTPEELRNIAGQPMKGDILEEVKRRMRLHNLPTYVIHNGKIAEVDRITRLPINLN